MRMTTLARGGAVSTAAVLALTLTSGPANADSDDSASLRAKATASQGLTNTGGSEWAPVAGGKSTANVKTPSVVIIDKLRIASGVLFRDGSNSVQILEINGEPGSSTGGQPPVKTAFTLKVGDKTHRGVLYKYDEGADVSYFDTKSGWGSGKAQILATTVTYADGTSSTDGTDSNVFYLRRAVKTSDPAAKISFYSPGTKVKVQPRGWKVFKPSSGKYVSLGKVRLQYRKSGSWKTLKSIKLDSRGNGSYTFKAPTRTYRLYVPKTSNVLGNSTTSVTG
ncbi:hypothetical protein [Aeromicrobium stalagmiti]|uniref:hypothetical protein n=1 Tax=Aeromicrobium stalagmiti TaxID=2738988 RepID=UPI001568A17D|nr:hypothetical protein [Aeromicrobium stalagmiti]NRQ48667.1 hypothetical protein [Aeromicrobium stalagmiti]